MAAAIKYCVYFLCYFNYYIADYINSNQRYIIFFVRKKVNTNYHNHIQTISEFLLVLPYKKIYNINEHTAYKVENIRANIINMNVSSN